MDSENEARFMEKEQRLLEGLAEANKKKPQLTPQVLANRFNHHAPQSDETKKRYEDIRRHCLSLALYLNANVPESREKSLAVTKLEEVMFWANAAIARND